MTFLLSDIGVVVSLVQSCQSTATRRVADHQEALFDDEDDGQVARGHDIRNCVEPGIDRCSRRGMSRPEPKTFQSGLQCLRPAKDYEQKDLFSPLTCVGPNEDGAAFLQGRPKPYLS